MSGWLSWYTRVGLGPLTFLRFSKGRIYNAFSRILATKERRQPMFWMLTLPWTVEALGWGSKKDKGSAQTVYADPNCMEAKLVNKFDQSLIEDLKLADKIYKETNGLTHKQIYEKLQFHKEKREAELHWRLARVTYELSKVAENAAGKLDLTEEAFASAKLALEIDDTNFAAHKWMAIILNQISSMKGTTEQIVQSYNVRHHMDRAAELNPKDATSMYLVGNWCFTVAEIPWYQRKVAETIFAKPPTCSFEQAVQYFLQAENIQPQFYSMNLLMLAKSYLKLGDSEKALEYLNLLNETPLTTDEDHIARKEGNELLKKLLKTKLLHKTRVQLKSVVPTLFISTNSNSSNHLQISVSCTLVKYTSLIFVVN